MKKRNIVGFYEVPVGHKKDKIVTLPGEEILWLVTKKITSNHKSLVLDSWSTRVTMTYSNEDPWESSDSKSPYEEEPTSILGSYKEYGIVRGPYVRRVVVRGGGWYYPKRSNVICWQTTGNGMSNYENKVSSLITLPWSTLRHREKVVDEKSIEVKIPVKGSWERSEKTFTSPPKYLCFGLL